MTTVALTGAPDVAFDVLRWVEFVAFLAVVVALLRRRSRAGNAGTGWVLNIFAILSAISLLGFVSPHNPHGVAWDIYVKILLVVLLLVPYFFVRFSESMGATGARVHRIATIGTGLVVVATLAAPTFPAAGQHRPAWVVGYVALVVGVWTLLSAMCAAGLWRRGAGEPTIARRRMRLLAAGTLLLAITLIIGSFQSGTTTNTGMLVQTALGLFCGVLFVLAFTLPGPIRLLWRQPELRRLGVAEAELMRALTPSAVADVLLPQVSPLVGGGGVALLDPAGRLLASRDLRDSEAAQISVALASPDAASRLVPLDVGTGVAGEPQAYLLGTGLVACPLRAGWLVVAPSVSTPMFGTDELGLVVRLGHLADLALERARLFSREQLARREAERANEELQALLYSVSHDLRSPLVSLVGYLGYLRDDYGHALPDGAGHYLARMDANLDYMRDLIQALLDLSRVGRTDAPPVDVQLEQLVAEVGAEVEHVRPAARMNFAPPLPTIRMNELRARQLFTNLLENATVHAGRTDVVVTVSAEFDPDGSVLVRVRDNGVGVPVAYRERVFGVFERLDAADPTTGTGIGLAICRRVMESIGGSISMGEPGDEDGAVFELHFPAAVVAQRPLLFDGAGGTGDRPVHAAALFGSLGEERS